MQCYNDISKLSKIRRLRAPDAIFNREETNMNGMKKILALSLALILAVSLMPHIQLVKANAETETTGPVVVWEDSFEVGENGTFDTSLANNELITKDGQDNWFGAAPKNEDYFYADVYTNKNGGVFKASNVGSGAWDGDRAIKFELDASSTVNDKLYMVYNLYELINDDELTLVDGKMYILSVWVKYDVIETSYTSQLQIKLTTNPETGETCHPRVYGAANLTEWTKLEVPFQYDKDQNPTINLNMETETGRGAVYFDLLQITELVDATGIVLNNTTAELEPEQTLQLTAGLNPATATTKVTYSWESNNKNVATVDANGKVTAVAGGVATITATAEVWTYNYSSRVWQKTNTKWTATCEVTVAFNAPVVVWEDSFEIGETFTENDVHGTTTTKDASPALWNDAEANTGDWWKADWQAGSVIISGGVGGARDGDSCISLATDPAASGRNAVYLMYNLNNIIGDGKLTLTDGKMYIFSVWIKYAENTTFTFEVMVQNTKTFAVGEKTSNQNPKVSEGTKTTEWTKVEVPFMYDSTKSKDIFANLKMVVSNTGAGTVYLDLLQITELVDATGISVDDTQVNAGEKVTLKPVMTPANASTTVTWSSSDPSVATVDADGVVTGVSKGTATITATAVVREYDFVNRSGWKNKDKFEDTCTVTVEDLFTLNGASVNLGTDLDMKFFIKPSDLSEGETYTAKMVRTYADGSTDTQEETVSEIYSDGDYYVTYKGLAAKEMGDKIAVTIYDSEGNAVSETWTDSIKDYVGRAMVTYADNADAVAMFEDMLNYGAAAQTAFNYDVNNLVNADLNKAVAEVTGTNVSANNDRDYWNGAELRLEGAITFKAFFKSDKVTQDMSAEVTFTNYKGTATTTYTVAGSDFGKDANDTDWYVPVTGLVIADTDTVITITIKNADGTEVVTVTDSIASYVIRYNALSNADADYVALNKAIMALGATAETYLKSK